MDVWKYEMIGKMNGGDERMDGRTEEWRVGRISGWIDENLFGRMDEWMNE